MPTKTKKLIAHSKNVGKTNTAKKSLVKVIALEDKGKWIKPEKGSTYFIDEDANLPDVRFEIETNQPAPYDWKWNIKWNAKVSGLRESSNRGKLLKVFEEKGAFTTDKKTWKMDFPGKIIGGFLTVEVKAGTEQFKRSVYIKGKNPSAEKLKNYVASIEGVKGFEKILFHEALGKNFINADGEPVVAFDKGYGISQLTQPAPTFEQIWSWKKNVDGGTKLYKEKRSFAKHDLDKHGLNSYTEEQLQLETYSRYNGGKYHEWDADEKIWVKKSDVLCDSSTTNIGWDTTEDVNEDKSESDLHTRDKDTYKKGKNGQSEENNWMYTGVCYADHVKNK